ncbi:Hypothetical protein ACI5QL_02879 [Bacillus velezensis]
MEDGEHDKRKNKRMFLSDEEKEKLLLLHKAEFLKISVNQKRSIGKSLVQALHSGSETFKTVE